MPNLLGPDFDPTVPADTEDVSLGASRIRDIKTRLKAFLGTYFNLDTAAWLAACIPSSALQSIVGLAPGTYTLATVTVNAQGQITAAANGALAAYKASGSIEQPVTGGTGNSGVPAAGSLLVGKTNGTYAIVNPAQAAGSGFGITITVGDGTIKFALDESFFPMIPFFYSATLSSATAAVAVALVPDFTGTPLEGRKIHLTDILARVDGATPWGTSTVVKVQGTDALPFVTIPVAALTANATVGKFTAGVVLADAITRATGGTASKGLQVVGDVVGTGSPLIVSGWGYYI